MLQFLIIWSSIIHFLQMREGLAASRYNSLIRSIEKDRLNHISPSELRFSVRDDPLVQKHRFDVRAHYKMLKENHPLFDYARPRRESQLKKTYVSMSESQPNLRSAFQTPKHTSVKKYGKQKLTKFKKSQQINFNEIYDKIKSIGS